MATQRFDIHQHITDRIVAALEQGAGQWQMPWHRGSDGRLPVNAESGRRYRGINVLALWIEAQSLGYSSHVWGTYRQWSAKGGNVRKGQKASYVVFYREIEVDSDEQDENGVKRRLVARATPVFNADQVDSLSTLEPAAPVSDRADIDQFITATNAVVHHGGSKACFIPSRDEIHMPERSAFIGSATSGPTEAYYSTLLHELTHWTAPAHRCDRDLSGRFGSEAYAMEELVAELGAAFLCSDFGLSAEPRADHAQYLAHWLKVLADDKRAIFTAASKAEQATQFLRDLTNAEPSAVSAS